MAGLLTLFSLQPIRKDEGIESFRVTVHVIGDEVAAVLIHREGPRRDVDLAILHMVFNSHFSIFAVARKYRHPARGGHIEAELKRESIQQVGDAVHPVEEEAGEIVFLQLRVDPVREIGV